MSMDDCQHEFKLVFQHTYARPFPTGYEPSKCTKCGLIKPAEPYPDETPSIKLDPELEKMIREIHAVGNNKKTQFVKTLEAHDGQYYNFFWSPYSCDSLRSYLDAGWIIKYMINNEADQKAVIIFEK